ncbi:MAG: hypothetical protein R2807_01680 [Chitinophagales bacterium]
MGMSINTYSSGIDLIAPINNFEQPDFNVQFQWNAITSQSNYRLQVSSTADFNTLDFDITTNQPLILLICSPSTQNILESSIR